MAMSQAFIGTLVDTPTPGALRIRKDHLIVVNSEGYITHILPSSSPQAQPLLTTLPSLPTSLPSKSFLLPTFSDLHIHAPQYLYAGTGLDLPLMEWLDKYAYRAEERIDSDPSLATVVYKRLCERLIQVGTGCVVLFGTIGVEANLILAKALMEAGLRGYVGKLSMDMSPRPTYGDSSTQASLSSITTFLDKMSTLIQHQPISQQLVKPILTPRFVPVCSDELLQGLSKISKERGIKIQSHMCESRDQMDWVESTRGKGDPDVFDQAGLLGEETVQAHVTSLKEELVGLVKQRGVTLAHCPLSNAYFSDAQFPLREAIDADLKVGLGSDIAGGYSLSIQTAMRQAVITSRLREGARRELEHENKSQTSGEEVVKESKNLRVDWKESLYVATRGGKKSLGLGGCFEVGMEFDAQLIQLAEEDGTSIGMLDIFDDTSTATSNGLDEAWWIEMIERWWCNGDDRNRKGMWVQGRQLGSTHAT